MPGHIRTPSRIRNRSVASLRVGGRRRTPLATALASLALVGAGAAHAQPRSAAAGSRPRARRRPTRRSRAACPTGNRRWGCRTARASRRPRASSCSARWATWGAPPRRSPRSRRRSARPRCRARHGRRGAGRPGGGRSQGGRQSDRRLAQRQGAGADRRQRPRQRRHRADRREGHPELGDLQRRPQYHGAIPPGSELGGAEPRQRSEGASVADPRPDQGRRHGDDRQPQRRGVRRQRAGERAQPGGAATRLSDEQFQNNGLYSADGKTPNFTDALGKIELRPGAVIETSRPSTVTQSGGYVLLLGREVDNAGTITTPRVRRRWRPATIS